MDMNKAFYMRKEDRCPQWHLVDAAGQTLGRLATDIAQRLRGKDKPVYTPHTDAGDYVVVINAEKIVLSGDKMEQKMYVRHSGWMGGKKETSARHMLEKHPTFIVEHAVKGMLPKNKLARQQIKKLKVYVGSKHPHTSHIK
jgi:large subunit ribosomal protein L13